MKQSVIAPKKYLFEINANCMLQLGIEVNNKKYVDRIIHFFSKTIIGLHLKLDTQLNGTNLICHTDEDPPIFKIPNALKKNISDTQNSIQQTSEMFISNHSVSPYIRLGSIGYNNNQVILNISHSVGDGGYFRYIIEKLNSYLDSDQENSIDFSNIPYFPRESTEIFKDIIEESPDPLSSWWNQSNVNRVYSKKIKKVKKITKDNPLKCKYITTRIPLDQLKNYSDLNQIHGLTDSLLTSIYIASNAHNLSGSSKFQFSDHISMPVCVDLRRYMKKNMINYSVCNNFSNVTPYAKVSHNDKIGNIGSKMKENMFHLMREGRDIGNLKTYSKMNFPKNNVIELNPENGCGVELTYTGPLRFKEPIVDIWAGHSLNVRSSTISLMGCGLANDSGKNEIVMRLRFPPNVFSEEEARNMAKSIEFCLKNASNNWNVQKAIEEVCNFHNKIV